MKLKCKNCRSCQNCNEWNQCIPSCGDYYITLIEYPMPESSQGSDIFKIIDYRMAMSGGNTHKHPDVRQAFVNLYRAMEKAKLNNHPKEDEYNNQIKNP